jgi:hypothetical protein
LSFHDLSSAGRTWAYLRQADTPRVSVTWRPKTAGKKSRSLTSRRRVGRQVGGGLFERGMSDEWRVCRDIFVRQSPTESDESDELGHPPRVTYVGRVGLCRGDKSRHTSRASRRVEYHCLRAWRPGAEESEATRRVTAKKGEYTVALCRSDASTRRYDSTI